MSIFSLQILLINLISCRFIHFENGYEYSYQYTSDSTIEGVGNFKTDAKVSLDFLPFSSSLFVRTIQIGLVQIHVSLSSHQNVIFSLHDIHVAGNVFTWH
jgi:hypothetical protein